MSRHPLNNIDIEEALKVVVGIPDNDSSEDDLESLDGGNCNVETLRRVLEDETDSSSINPPPSQEVNCAYDDPGPSTSGIQQNPIQEIQESMSEDESELEESSGDEDDDWKKTEWVGRPDAEVFDEKMLRTNYFLSSRARPVAHFDNFFCDKVFDLIVFQTNLYAEQTKPNGWVPVTRSEIRAFLGILIIMGYHVLPSIDLYWSTDPSFRVCEVADVMPIKRFKNIMRSLHLNDNSQQPDRSSNNFDKLYKLRPLLSLVNENCLKNAKNTSSQSIDECMILFKGRSSLKQYMPLKPIKRGYKVWCRCDSVTGYLYEFSVYTGKTGTGTEEGLGAKVVKDLTNKLMGEEFKIHITFDNFFCDFSLLKYLHENGLYASGTVRRNRANLPKIIKKNSPGDRSKKLKLEKGQYKWRTKDDVAFVVWQDNKEVLLLSNTFHPKNRTTVSRTQKDGSKRALACPQVVKEYTKRMGGVDRFDQVRNSYSVGRRSKRWWLRIFYFLLDVCITNACLLYSQTTRTTKLTHLEFRVAVARGLIAGFSNRKRKSDALSTATYKTTNKSAESNRQKVVGAVPQEVRFMNVGDHMPVDSTYRRCKYCSTKINDKRSKIMCGRCKVPLCVTPCFADFHRS